MRDRLIELLQDIEHQPEKTCPKQGTGEECGDCQYKLETEKWCDLYARKADYLIAKGVIVPPCKVGDIVYEICFGKLSEQKIIKKSKVTAIKITDKITITLDHVTNLCDADIGRWLFVGEDAKKRAEQALKEVV